MIIVKETNFYISDDKCHDLNYVQNLFQIFYDHLKDKDIHMDRHWIWSDGCVDQFKNVHVLDWLNILHKTYNVSHIWNYFKTGHGKGKHNGSRECIKTTLHREDNKFMRNPHILDAKSIVQWCSTVMSHGANEQQTSTMICYVIINF